MKNEKNKANMEARQYALPNPGGDGKLRPLKRKAKYYYDSLGGDNLQLSGDGVNLHTSGALFLSDHPGKRRVCDQLSDGGIGARGGLLWREIRQRGRQVPGDETDTVSV